VQKHTLILTLAILSIFFGSCGRAHDEPLPEITSQSEGGFHDLTFSIRHSEKMPDGSQALHAFGLHHGRELGLIVILGPKWPKASLSSNMPFSAYQGLVTYRSIGAKSDTLIQIMDELYGTALHPKAMRKETKFTGISLEGQPANLERGITKIKLFNETDVEDQEAELFTDIDLQHALLQINEKDPDYRKAVIHALRAD
jgi:hypothetical protein